MAGPSALGIERQQLLLRLDTPDRLASDDPEGRLQTGNIRVCSSAPTEGPVGAAILDVLDQVQGDGSDLGIDDLLPIERFGSVLSILGMLIDDETNR
jgi:hypothetical protein